MDMRVVRVLMPISRTGTLNRSPGGFTLLELIVVVFIISLFLAVVTPSLYPFLEGKAEREPRRVLSVISYIYDSAINTKESLKLKIDFKSRVITYDTPEGERKMKVSTLSSVKIPSHGEVRTGELTLTFGPFGYPEPFEIYFKGNRYLSFNPFSGRVSLLTLAK